MQTVIEIDRLKPLNTKVLIKKVPMPEQVRGIEIPEEYRDRNSNQGQLYYGAVIAVGPGTKASRLGHRCEFYEPGDEVLFFNLWDWKDREVVIKDAKSGDDYLIVDESGIKAIRIYVGAGAN